MIRLHIGDVRAVLAEMEPGSVDLVATSWPFLALRSYLPADHPDKRLEIGQEPTPAAYLDTLLDVTEGFARVLAPHGSICTELGDTQAGSGGAGGDYNADGLRDGQEKFSGSARSGGRNRRADEAAGIIERRNGRSAQVPGWPLDKSACVIPHLYAACLAYGRNLLNPERTTDPWRVRNIVAWCRANPPVGSLGGGNPEDGTGDARFRPATSYLTIACKGRSRWFDLDAVRTTPKSDPAKYSGNGYSKGSPEGIAGNEMMPGNPAGAPPLDWWKINPKGYSGAHFAVWPLELLTRPIQSMCPRRVCRTCGMPSRRITAPSGAYGDLLGESWADRDEGRGKASSGARSSHAGQPVGSPHIQSAQYTTLGWSVCGCPDTGEEAMWAPDWRGVLAALRTAQKAERAAQTDDAKSAAKDDQRRHADRLAGLWLPRSLDGFHSGQGWRPGVVLDPFAGSGTTLLAASELSRDAVGIDIDERTTGLLAERMGPLVGSMVEVIQSAR